MSDFDILVGYVNHFSFNDKMSEEILQGHPKKGRVYQLIKDDRYGYRLHIGAENTKDNMMEGILLGSELVGEHDEKWNFNIEVVDKENFLTFNLDDEDTKKVQDWFSTDNKSLRETLQKPAKIVAQDTEGNLVDRGGDSDRDIESIVAGFRASAVSDALNAIMSHDKRAFTILSRLIVYLASRYVPDQIGKLGIDPVSLLLTSESPDVAIYGVLDCLQTYTLKDHPDYMNSGKVYEAIDYLLLELQRKEKHD
jgi:hypothetical protein